MVYFYAAYLICMNTIAFFMMRSDKRRAKRGAWRIPERVLFSMALLGGAPGIFLGMRLFRHKTRHALFCIGVPLVLLAQGALLYVLFIR